jgi:hypothetical protein
VKTTEIVHDCPGVKFVTQPFELRLNSGPGAVLVVFGWEALTVSVCPFVSVFVTVTDCGALVAPTVVLPNVRMTGEVAGFVETVSPTNTPRPLSPTFWGLSMTSSLIVKSPERELACEGVKTTVTKQLSPAASWALGGVPQVLFDTEKSPEAVMAGWLLPEEVKLSVPVPEFVIVTVFHDVGTEVVAQYSA